MNLKEIRELIEFLKEQDIAEFELERGDVKVRIKRGAEAVSSTRETHYVTVPSAVTTAPAQGPAAAVPPAAAEPTKSADKQPTEATPEEGLHLVKSPIV